MSAVEMSKALKNGNGDTEEISQYERKLVQVCKLLHWLDIIK